jgi:DNA-binding CsgD family transcriptional regulator
LPNKLPRSAVAAALIVTVTLGRLSTDLPNASLSPETLNALVSRLNVAIFVFRRQRLIYLNPAAERLIERLRSSYRIELEVMLRDHLSAVWDPTLPSTPKRVPRERPPIVTMLTATNGEPFYIHVIPLSHRSTDVAVSVRSLGSESDAFRRRYRLTKREAQVAELVLHGYKNADIGSALGISPTTVKRHLTRIFDKVGVNSRSQLQMRLA